MSAFSGRQFPGARKAEREYKRREAAARNGRAARRPRSDCCGAVTYTVPAGGIACRACGNGCQAITPARSGAAGEEVTA